MSVTGFRGKPTPIQGEGSTYQSTTGFRCNPTLIQGEGLSTLYHWVYRNPYLIHREAIEEWFDDPESACNHLVLGMNLDQRRQARGLNGKKSVHNWV